MLTARGNPLFKETAFESGADAYITKPFEQNELLQLIHSLLEQKETQKENNL